MLLTARQRVVAVILLNAVYLVLLVLLADPHPSPYHPTESYGSRGELSLDQAGDRGRYNGRREGSDKRQVSDRRQGSDRDQSSDRRQVSDSGQDRDRDRKEDSYTGQGSDKRQVSNRGHKSGSGQDSDKGWKSMSKIGTTLPLPSIPSTNTTTSDNTITPDNTTTPANTITPANNITPENTITLTNTTTPINTTTPTNTTTPANTSTQLDNPTTRRTPKLASRKLLSVNPEATNSHTKKNRMSKHSRDEENISDVATAGGPSPQQSHYLTLDMTLSSGGVTLKVDDRQEYQLVNKTTKWGSGMARLHAGLHLVVLHQYTGRLMAADSFTTWQMTSDTAFLSAFHNIQDGRLILILGAPDFTTFLGKEAMEELEWFGSNYISNMAYKDVWCLVLYKGGGVVAEAVTTYFVEDDPRSFDLDSSPLNLQLAVLPTQEPQCSWYNLPQLTQRATFCRSYEGYGHFCRCDRLPWSPRPLRHSPQTDEVIPVAIVTGGRLPQVLRQVDQIRASPGGDTTPIMIFVDGASPEADALANLLQVTVTHHSSQIPIGTTRRINAHFKFVLSHVFMIQPKAKTVIILEDDLDLAPDIIQYFSQTNKLLTSDPGLLCVNAFNNNAFPHTSYNPSRLYRVHGVPACGWMVTRLVAYEMVNNWVPDDWSLDWDLWVRQRVLGHRSIIVPEVPRTKHIGQGGGVHVTGLEQALLHDQRPLNTLSHVTLDLHSVEGERYLDTHRRAILSGRMVPVTKHLCLSLPFLTTKCLGLNDHVRNENLRMMYTISFYGNQLYIICCPTSPFCFTKDPDDWYRVESKDVTYANLHPFRKPPYTSHLAMRVPPTSLHDQLALTNIAEFEYD
ncbi:hypothetical protein Pmani_011368 [Petrolisthes manimaculis]|uniref:ILEI/PANDER domain-containing protein n=1 Tax=Petrolisthes manimaculis TaxID=1843537 RepID=A0AAE1Q194_9EUCA|nr:hypothetical protein Pmani_011368 [Petrolisthes manimaculis]